MRSVPKNAMFEFVYLLLLIQIVNSGTFRINGHSGLLFGQRILYIPYLFNDNFYFLFFVVEVKISASFAESSK